VRLGYADLGLQQLANILHPRSLTLLTQPSVDCDEKFMGVVVYYWMGGDHLVIELAVSPLLAKHVMLR